MATAAPTRRRTNESEGTRAHLSNLRTSPYKVREVLDLIRGQEVRRAQEILRFCQRGPAEPVGKLLNSAIANAVENDELDAETLFVSSCYADEGPTMKRFRPRAKGRAGRIRKRSSKVTIVVSRLPEDRLARVRDEQVQESSSRRRRVAGSRAARVAGSKKTDPEQETEVVETSDTSVDQPADAETSTDQSVEAVEPSDATETRDDQSKDKS